MLTREHIISMVYHIFQYLEVWIHVFSDIEIDYREFVSDIKIIIKSSSWYQKHTVDIFDLGSLYGFMTHQGFITGCLDGPWAVRN